MVFNAFSYHLPVPFLWHAYCNSRRSNKKKEERDPEVDSIGLADLKSEYNAWI
jgi:hypothetical protein